MSVEFTSARPWAQQYHFNEETLANITGWTTGTALAASVYDSSVVVTKNRVYLLGGYDQAIGTVATVRTAPINTDGTLGTWTTATSLPGQLSSSTVLITKNRVYLLGGHTGSAVTNLVYTAPINEDGTLGTWATATSLPGGLRDSSVVVTKNRVYLLGGNNGGVCKIVYTAPLNEDGTIGTWASGTDIPRTLNNSCAIVTNSRVYLLGGYDGLDGGADDRVQTAPINEDGTIGTWSAGTGLPGNTSAACVVVIKNRVYLIGGRISTASAIVYTAPINEDGTLGTWSAGTSIPGVLGESSVIVTSSKIYLLGGKTTVGVNTVYQADFPGGFNEYLDLSWEEIFFLIRAAFEQIYGIRFAVAFEQLYGDAPRLRNRLEQYYGDAAILRRRFEQLYGDAPQYRAAFEQLYNLHAGLRAAFEQHYSIAEGQIRAAFDQLYNLQDKDLIRQTLDMIYVLAAGEALVQRFDIEVTCDGVVHTSMSNINIEQDSNSFHMVGELQLYDEAEYLQYRVYVSEVEITVDSWTVNLIAGMPREARTPGQSTYIIPLFSRTVWLEALTENSLGYLQTAGELSGMAKTLVENLAAPITVTWSLVDWFIPPGRLAANDGDNSLALIRRIVESAGGIIQTDPDGNLVCRPEYPVSVSAWETVEPDYYLTDQDDFFQVDHAPELRSGYNWVNVSDQQLATGGLTMEVTEIDGYTKEVRVYQVPWDDNTRVILRHSGDPGRVAIVAGGALVETISDEQAEIIGGSGRTSKPFYRLIASDYREADLGAINIKEDGTITTAKAENSLVLLTYWTRCWKFTVTDRTTENVQFFPEVIET